MEGRESLPFNRLILTRQTEHERMRSAVGVSKRISEVKSDEQSSDDRPPSRGQEGVYMVCKVPKKLSDQDQGDVMQPDRSDLLRRRVLCSGSCLITTAWVCLGPDRARHSKYR